MFKILIAEDEMFVRIGIKNSIKWSKFGMEVIDDVADGLQAWESYKENKPDLILTDWKMPQMDGLELISKIRSQDKETRIIILSNIEDFKAAQKAMVLGVSAYILKLTMTWDEMDEILMKVSQELEQQYEAETNKIIDKEEASLLKTRIFSDCYTGQVLSTDYIEGIVEKKKLRLVPRNLVLCMMEIDRYDAQNASTGPLSTRRAIINLMSEILDGYQRGEIVHYTEKNYALLFSFSDLTENDESKAELLKILDHIKRLMNAYFNLSVTFAISSMRDGYAYAKDQYEECNAALLNKFYVGSGSYLFSDDDVKDRVTLYVQPVLIRAVEEFKQLFGEGYRKEFEDDLAKLQTSESSWHVKKFFLVLLQLPLTIMKIIRQDLFLLQVSYADKIKECETLDEISDIYVEFLREISNIIGRKAAYSREMQLSLHFIKENYQDEISLKQVALFANLSSNYLSTVFKNEMEINFVDYLAQYRVEKSKELLLGSNLKLYEISERVGFREVSYFCRIFKRITGYRPNEFKRKFLLEELL